MVLINNIWKPKVILATAIGFTVLYSGCLIELGRELGHADIMEVSFHRRSLRADRNLQDCGGHPTKLYGHVHMAKTGGSSINGIMANKFERVCGHKGYSYDAYKDNKIRAKIAATGGETKPGRGRIFEEEMEAIGFDDCDWVSNEVEWTFWSRVFGDSKFHSFDMELHVPCRDPVDHLMSQCNHIHRELNCDADTDEEYFKSVEDCFVRVRDRYNHKLKHHFNVKCYDFSEQFTGYLNLMSDVLEDRRYQTEDEEYAKRDSNTPRDKEHECIWKNPELVDKTKAYLLENVEYYSFCDKCLGSDNDLLLATTNTKSAATEAAEAAEETTNSVA